MKRSQSGSVSARALFHVFIIVSLSAAMFLITDCVTPSILVTQEQNKGDALFNQHNYAEAAKHYDLMLGNSRKLGIYRNLSMESDVHRKIANCYEMTGKYDQSLEHVQSAMVLDSTDKNLLGTIEDHRQKGKIYIYMGSYQRGILSLEKSLSLSEGMEQSIKNVNRLSIADTYLALGQLYAVLGKMNKALEYTGKSLAIYKEAPDKRGEMESYLTIGSIFSDQGDNQTAKNFVEQSLKGATELGLGTARHNQLLSSIAASTGDYENALRLQEKALQDAKKFGIVGQIVWATIGTGDIYRDIGDFSRAEKFYKMARETKDTASASSGSLKASLDLRLGDALAANQFFASEGSVSGEGISSLRLSEILIRSGKSDSALIFLNQSGRLFSQSGNKQGLSNVKLLKGRILVDRGDLAEAKQLLDSATLVPEFPETVWQAWFHLGRMYEKQMQDEKAIESYKKSIIVIEKIRGNLTIDEFKSIYFDNKREVYDRLINILLKNNMTVEAFQTSEQARARAFFDILANKKINFRGALPGDLITREQEKRIEIQKLYLLLQKGNVSLSDNEGSRKIDMRQVRTALTDSQDEYEDILQKIKLSNPAYSEMVSVQPVNLSEVQAALDPKTAMVTYWISDNELICWVISKTTLARKSMSITRTKLTSMIESCRKAIQSNSASEANKSLNQLYSILITPIESSIGQLSNLIIVPNGPLHFLPFQALMNSRKEYLVQKFNILYSPSASVYLICRSREVRAGSGFMGMALSDITVGNNMGLPGTEDELKKILPLFKDKISTFGIQSTETFIKKNAGSYNFLHFATHGIYNYRQPLYSHLLFPPSNEDDGRLNVFEVFELNINAKLVTLSACETGLGNLSQGDELTGLSRAFLFAGSSSVIVSLWPVADYPTSLLMSNFYKYLKDRPIQEALTLAQRDVLKIYPQPLYWSPFILIGNGKVSAN
jgi:CHAT domain-containing protein/predicted negative regulator of RcsB-dependent stress response